MKFYTFRINLLSKWILSSAAIITIIAIVYFSSGGAIAVISQQRRELPIYCVENSENKIALTFDCAWGSEDIPDILNTLKQSDVRATFFFVGLWAKKNPEAVKMIAEQGHDIANHSYSHFRMGSISNEKIRTEILEGDRILEGITGKKVDLFRAPYGDYNNSIIRIARELNHYTIQWDVDSLDWKPGISADEIKNRILRNVKSGSILLFHNDTPHTANILPDIIDMLKNKGYDFIPVSEIIIRDNYEIDHEGRQKRKK